MSSWTDALSGVFGGVGDAISAGIGNVVDLGSQALTGIENLGTSTLGSIENILGLSPGGAAGDINVPTPTDVPTAPPVAAAAPSVGSLSNLDPTILDQSERADHLDALRSEEHTSELQSH